MDFLERRYKGKLDFTELEVDYQLSQIDLPFPFSDLFNDNDSGLIDDPEDEES